jgi:transposase-like protein
LLTEEILEKCDRRASRGRGDRSGEKIADLAEEFGVTEGTLKVQLAKFRKSKLTSTAPDERSKLTSPPPVPKPRKSPPASKKGGGNASAAPEIKELMKVNEELRRRLGDLEKWQTLCQRDMLAEAMRISNLEGAAQPRRRTATKPAPRQEEILAALDDGPMTYEVIGAKLGTRANLRPTIVKLVKAGKVSVEKRLEHRGTRRMWVNYIRRV